MIVGKIYFVSAPGRIKIGYTRQPEKRLASLRSVDMEELTSLGVIPGTRSLEKTLHDRISAYRVRGEWFVDCEAVRAVISNALAGKYPVGDADVSQKPTVADHAALDEVALAAVRESSRLASEIERKMKNREDVSELVNSACFLGEQVIARIIGGLDRA